jgi:hypothetical protein
MVRDGLENDQEPACRNSRELSSSELLAKLRIFHIGGAMKAGRSGRRMVP